ncbi:hypothetical protein [Kibdelosporangium phytohabitans]|uniref:Uncharacterized protein n=1 Tax=Kibdelosporangium phytohabitans TaxID=860235 RepID=A0A0N9HXD9_9PSEU|nr:hypothetical protein [Kibdelosporangium phytohabitans]ALG06888.1 hypothetical protein AOZ06_08035 [Kibdelosporangium phytohabitans]MBE1468139.1 hypothetical protein [Kibdelosporangium phytohabitans]
MKNYTLICDAPGLPLSKGSLTHAEWRKNERLSAVKIRGGALLIAPKQMSTQGTSVRTVQTGDFPYFPVRAEAQGLT